MPREPKIWHREQDGCYYTNYRRRQHKLGDTEAEAKKEFHKLMAADAPPADKAKVSVKALCDLFLQFKAGPDPARRTTATGHVVFVKKSLNVLRSVLQPFCDRFGTRRAADLTVGAVREWIDTKQSWGPSTKALAITLLKSAFNWADTEGRLRPNPIKKLPRREIAVRQQYVSAGDRLKVIAAARGPIKDFLLAVHLTGARPFSELCQLTKAMIDWQGERVELEKHKNAHKGKRRVLYFPPEMMALLRGLAEKHPEGPLFCTTTGSPWQTWYVRGHLLKLSEKAGIPYAPLYSWRHSFITDSLVKGIAVEVLSELVGNSPAIINKVYNKIFQRHDALRDAARRAVG